MFFLLFSQVLSALDILQPPQIDCFEEMYPSSHTQAGAACCSVIFPAFLCLSFLPPTSILCRRGQYRYFLFVVSFPPTPFMCLFIYLFLNCFSYSFPALCWFGVFFYNSFAVLFPTKLFFVSYLSLASLIYSLSSISQSSSPPCNCFTASSRLHFSPFLCIVFVFLHSSVPFFSCNLFAFKNIIIHSPACFFLFCFLLLLTLFVCPPQL